MSDKLPILVIHPDHKAARFHIEVGVVGIHERFLEFNGCDGVAIILIYGLLEGRRVSHGKIYFT